VRLGERGVRREVPGGDPAAYVRRQLRVGETGETEAPSGRIRVPLSSQEVRPRIPERYAAVEPDGESACVVISTGPWSQSFLVWMALLDLPMQVLDPPELVDAARTLASRLAHAA
jgi:hypothetical protein